jgi:hypothetical protein
MAMVRGQRAKENSAGFLYTLTSMLKYTKGLKSLDGNVVGFVSRRPHQQLAGYQRVSQNYWMRCITRPRYVSCSSK